MGRVQLDQLSGDEFYEFCLNRGEIIALEHASEAVRDDKELVSKLLEIDVKDKRTRGMVLEFLSDRLKDDSEIVMTCIRSYPPCFEWASERLRNDRDFCLQVISIEPRAMGDIGEALWDDKQFVMAAYDASGDRVKSNLPFDRVSERLRDDEEVAYQYCRTGFFYQFVSDRLRDDEDLCRFALQSSGGAFEYASERLRDDASFASVVGDPNVWLYQAQYVSQRLKNDREFVWNVCLRNVDCLECFSEEIRDDRNFMSLLCVEDFRALEYASDRLKQDRDFVWPIIRKDSLAFDYVSKFHNDDDEIAWHILEHSSDSLVDSYRVLGSFGLFDFSDRLKDDREFVLAWIVKSGSSISAASDRFKEDLELNRVAMAHGARFRDLGQVARSDYDLVLMGVLEDGESLELASEELRNDKSIVLAAIHNTMPYVMSWRVDDWWGEVTHDVFCYIGDELKKDEEFARIVIKAFMQTYYREKYDEAELMKDPCQIYDIITKERDLYDLFEEEPEQKLDLSMELAQYNIRVE